MPRVAASATMVVGAAMVIRVDFHRARRLHSGEAHQHQQNQESSRELAEYTHA